MTNRILTTTAITLALAAPAYADPSVGFGLTVTFGGASVDYGVGARVFSGDEQDEFAASLGVDYMFQSQRIRPTVGAAYLGDGSYIGFDLGIGLNGEGIDFGVGVGGADTEDDPTPPDNTAPEKGPVPD